MDVTHINNEFKNKIKKSNLLLDFGLHVSIKLENYKEFVKEKPKIHRKLIPSMLFKASNGEQ